MKIILFSSLLFIISTTSLFAQNLKVGIGIIGKKTIHDVFDINYRVVEGFEVNGEYNISDKLSIESAVDYYPPRNWGHTNYHLDGSVKLNYFFLESFKLFKLFISAGVILRNTIITKRKPSRRPDELEILLGLGIRKEIRKIELFVQSNLSHSYKTELMFAGGIKHTIGKRTKSI